MVKADAATIEAVVRQVLAARQAASAPLQNAEVQAAAPAPASVPVAAAPAASLAAPTMPAAPVVPEARPTGHAAPKPSAGEPMDFWRQVNAQKPAPPPAAHLSEERDADLEQMKSSTTARVCIGRSGPRLTTRALLCLRADHAAARDAVMADADEDLLERLGLFTIQTLCENRSQHLTRPDLGRQFGGEALAEMKRRCKPKPQVQVYLSDGLNALALNDNAENFLAALGDGLAMRGISTGTPFFVRYGRVPSMERLAEVIDPEVICLLVGERPGLGGNQSMSAYIAYRPTVGMPESRRTVLSNIHSEGTPAAEAGAYTAELLERMLKEKRSGVDLKL